MCPLRMIKMDIFALGNKNVFLLVMKKEGTLSIYTAQTKHIIQRNAVLRGPLVGCPF